MSDFLPYRLQFKTTAHHTQSGPVGVDLVCPTSQSAPGQPPSTEWLPYFAMYKAHFPEISIIGSV